MQSGDIFKVETPPTFPSPYHMAGIHWITDMVDLDGKDVELISPTVLYFPEPNNPSNFMQKAAWTVQVVTPKGYLGLPKGRKSASVPTEWLKQITSTAQPVATSTSTNLNIAGAPQKTSSTGYCVPCGGIGKHRLMCPASRV